MPKKAALAILCRVIAFRRSTMREILAIKQELHLLKILKSSGKIRIMKEPVKRINRFALILTSTFACLFVIQSAHAGEPRYNDKPLSEWLLVLEEGHTMFGDHNRCFALVAGRFQVKMPSGCGGKPAVE